MKGQRENCTQVALRTQLCLVTVQSTGSHQTARSKQRQQMSSGFPGLLASGWLRLERFVAHDKVTPKTPKGDSVHSLAPNWGHPGPDASRRHKTVATDTALLRPQHWAAKEGAAKTGNQSVIPKTPADCFISQWKKGAATQLHPYLPAPHEPH